MRVLFQQIIFVALLLQFATITLSAAVVLPSRDRIFGNPYRNFRNPYAFKPHALLKVDLRNIMADLAETKD